ncbi:MAG: TrpB-like pyridoxal phosphate-dependent enzyme [Clostridia bacterium]|nr:TrpB-like pyridoxal phosphate-dependent enzyme [Clostridia bacterium]
MLEEKDMPVAWYNIQADMPNLPKPYLHPGTLQPVGPADLLPIFPEKLIMQEVSTERWIEIPEEVRFLYESWRPAPLYRAYSLEKALDTPAKIFYKYEGVNASGSHKLNTAIPQVYYNKEAGITRLSTETGAGQWGSALSVACSMFGLECAVYMVKISYQQKPYRKAFMEAFGSSVAASPSPLTDVGRAALAQNPDNLGSLGLAISEAVEDAAKRADTNYALGSVLNHVLLHQSIIGLEAKKQMEMFDEYPDVIFGCCGGGSNFAGLSFPFVNDKLTQNKKVRVVAVEPTACPTLTKGTFAYDYGDTAKMAPIAMMYTLGHDFMPPGIHAGGLRYHGDSALVSQLYHDGIIEAEAYGQKEIFEAAVTFARSESILPAPESAHAIRAVIAEAERCKESGESKNILFCLSGHGIFDLGAYNKYFANEIEDACYSEDLIKESLKKLPKIG